MNEDEPNMLISFEHTLSVVRIIGDNIVPSNITIKSEIYPLRDNLQDEEFDLSLSKIKFWLETIVSRCVVFSRNNPIALKLMLDENGKNICNNLLMLLPFEPTDEQMAIVFQAKLAALSSGFMAYGDVQIKSSNYSDLTFTFVGDPDDLLPDMNEWVGPISYFDKPWWHRDDSSTLDVIPPEGSDLNEKPSWAYSLDFLSQTFKPKIETDIRGFKPVIIDGGKTD